MDAMLDKFLWETPAVPCPDDVIPDRERGRLDLELYDRYYPLLVTEE